MPQLETDFHWDCIIMRNTNSYFLWWRRCGRTAAWPLQELPKTCQTLPRFPRPSRSARCCVSPVAVRPGLLSCIETGMPTTLSKTKDIWWYEITCKFLRFHKSIALWWSPLLTRSCRTHVFPGCTARSSASVWRLKNELKSFEQGFVLNLIFEVLVCA